jgi:hypothetical protein
MKVWIMASVLVIVCAYMPASVVTCSTFLQLFVCLCHVLNASLLVLVESVKSLCHFVQGS